MRNIKRGLWLIAVGVWLYAFSVQADDGEKGCYVTYNSKTGKFLFEPFVKTGDKEYANEGGEPEIWGYRPWSESAKKDDKPLLVNVLESRYIPSGKAKDVPAGTSRRYVRCPEGF